MPDEQRRILDMLAAGKLSVDEANNLLTALGSETSANPASASLPKPPPVPPKPPVSPARMLRVIVNDGEKVNVNVNIPIALARFGMKFIPAEARQELENQGIHLNDIFDMLKGEVPEGRLIDIDADDEGKPVRVVVEVR